MQQTVLFFSEQNLTPIDNEYECRSSRDRLTNWLGDRGNSFCGGSTLDDVDVVK